MEWIQNSDITKQRQLQNSDSYKTATVTKRRLLQNDDCCKKIFLYIQRKHYVRYLFQQKYFFHIFLQNRKARFL